MNGNLEDMPTKGPKDRMVEAYLSGLSLQRQVRRWAIVNQCA